MAEPLKHMYNPALYRSVATQLREIYPAFEAEKFYKKATRGLDDLELNDRMRRTADLFREFLPDDFAEAMRIIIQFAPALTGYAGVCVPEYIGNFGREDRRRFDATMRALAQVTEYSSAEFAVRAPFSE